MMRPAAPASWMLPFGATLIAMFALQLSNLGFSPLLPSIQQEFGMSYTQLGLFTGLYGLLAMLLSVPAGVSARRFGEKRVLAIGLLGVAAGSVLLGEAWSFESALTFRGLTIFGYRFAFVSVLIAVALTAPASLRGRTMGVLGATSALASVVGAPLGGVLVGEFGWRFAILGYAAMAVLGAAVFSLFYRPTPPQTASVDPHLAHDADRRSAFLSATAPCAGFCFPEDRSSCQILPRQSLPRRQSHRQTPQQGAAPPTHELSGDVPRCQRHH